MQKNLKKILLLDGLIYPIAIVFLIKNFLGLLQKKEKQILDKEEYLKTYEKWMNKVQDGKKLSSYFKDNHYHTVAIYGMGRIGRHLYRDIQSADIKVEYGIDRSVLCYDTIKCYTLNDELPYVDLIIVTVSAEADNIINMLRKKIDCPIQSIDNILFML